MDEATIGLDHLDLVLTHLCCPASFFCCRQQCVVAAGFWQMVLAEHASHAERVLRSARTRGSTTCSFAEARPARIAAYKICIGSCAVSPLIAAPPKPSVKLSWQSFSGGRDGLLQMFAGHAKAAKTTWPAWNGTAQAHTARWSSMVGCSPGLSPRNATAHGGASGLNGVPTP